MWGSVDRGVPLHHGTSFCLMMLACLLLDKLTPLVIKLTCPLKNITDMSYKEKAKQQREQAIMDVARQLIMKHGYAPLTMEKVAEEVGISKPTLYQHFKSKEHLVGRILAHDLHAMKAQFEHLNDDAPAIERLKAVLRNYLKARYMSGSILPMVGYEMYTLIKVNAELQAHRQANLTMFHNLVEAAKAEGQIKPDIPTHLIVRIIFTMRGALHDPFADAPPNLTETEIDHTVEALLVIFLQGIAL